MQYTEFWISAGPTNLTALTPLRETSWSPKYASKHSCLRSDITTSGVKSKKKKSSTLDKHRTTALIIHKRQAIFKVVNALQRGAFGKIYRPHVAQTLHVKERP